jgi:hypothetical protein
MYFVTWAFESGPSKRRFGSRNYAKVDFEQKLLRSFDFFAVCLWLATSIPNSQIKAKVFLEKLWHRTS